MDTFIDREPLFECVVNQEPASKANSRRLVKWGKRVVSIKSAKAEQFVRHLKGELAPRHKLLTQDLIVELVIFYKTRRPDLDESLVLDALQGIAYENDRQVKKKLVTWGLDPANPRCHVKIYAVQEGDLPGDPRRVWVRTPKKRRAKVVVVEGLPVDLPPGGGGAGDLAEEHSRTVPHEPCPQGPLHQKVGG